MRWYDTVCQTNFSKWFCLVRGQNRSLLQRGGFQFRARLWKVTRFNFYQIYLRPGLIILFKGIRYVRNYRHKAGLCWAPSSLHLCNWLFLSPIRSHKVLVAKDQCAKWFHYIQKPFGKRKKKREREKPRLSQRDVHTLTEKQTNIRIGPHTHTHTHTHIRQWSHVLSYQRATENWLSLSCCIEVTGLGIVESICRLLYCI